MIDFKAAIFDLDGTLIDSNDVWNRIDVEFLAKRGFDVPSDYLTAVRSLKFSEAADYTIARFHLDDVPETLMREWYDMAIDQYSNHVPLKPNAGEYLSFLRGRGVRLATATGLPRELYEPVLKNNGVFDLFEAHTSADETPRGKEFPDVYQLAAQKLSLAPAECIVFEDVLACLKSAVLAGMSVCAVYDPAAEKEWLQMTALASFSVRNFGELMAD